MKSSRSDTNQPRRAHPRAWLGLLAGLAVLAVPGIAGASLQERYDETKRKLDKAERQEGVLSDQVAAESRRLRTLRSEVAGLQTREEQVTRELQVRRAKLRQASRRLAVLRERLLASIEILETRLVDLYKAGEPDMLTVIIKADGFDDLVERADFMARIQQQDSAIVTEVRDLRNEMRVVYDRVKAARDEVARQRKELRDTREALQERSAQLAEARAAHQASLREVSADRKELEGDLSDISAQIAQQLGGYGSIPAGPIRPGSAGFIWPVSGSIVSGFGPRWGRMHEGVDIAAPAGTPIRAAKGGRIALSGWYGGYGNYTCIDHGGGLSSCYAHQSRYAVTGGSVRQGQVIGYVGCTGHCYGDHLHFEVRIGGQAVDPMPYL